MVRIVLAGFGAVGQTVARLVASGHPAASSVVISAVSDQRYGTVIAPSGIDPASLVAAVDMRGTFQGLPGEITGGEVLSAIDASGADVLVELTFTDLLTGEPATSHIRHALERGLSVVTTNKGPIALHLDELQRLAERTDLELRFEGTVMSGTPALLVAATTIRHAGFIGAVGLLNGTTNHMISRMEAGRGYEEALAESQAAGYAEADPSSDVTGLDAAGKLTILSRVLLDEHIPTAAISRIPLDSIAASEIELALREGRPWRHLATLEMTSGGWTASVAPRQLAASDPMASVRGGTNAITFRTELLGDVTLIGPGAGRDATAFAVLNDLQLIRRGRA